ncbi:hypothetical protein [Psychrobacillus psychrodurans]|uniref:hypothetical protein n=1 Tax=Psychrobacillus psychrodurans TaxID=126157 RepID=UPI0008E9F65F|nr:hypothetical protein [Psychrobacillus psychrodurans]MCZ8539693.1 hypothetical protein [Psychrobacillus psychrodurans]SFM94302.1 hypothetical protein SAMN05421832_109154 [Psychrobacillus psychrodurans]
MKRKMIALPLAISSLLILGACGDDDADVDDIEVNDPLLEDDGENDAGIENEANDEEEKIQDDDTTDDSSDNSNE